jgi:hypothetical protein
MSKVILSAAALLLPLVSGAWALPASQGSQLPVNIKQGDDDDASLKRYLWRESQGEADWYDGNQDDRYRSYKRYSYRPPDEDSDCFAVGPVWYCP